MGEYSAREYWSRVGDRIARRTPDVVVVAGDNTPFYRLKRAMFLSELLDPALGEASCRSVLEVGCGPGGNLVRLRREDREVHGIDISPEMVELARANGVSDVRVVKDAVFPFPALSFDAVFTATVLQHNDSVAARRLLGEMARVATREIHLFEDTAGFAVRDRPSHWLRRPSWYREALGGHGFVQTVEQRLPLAFRELGATVARMATTAAHEGSTATRRREWLEARLLKAGGVLDRLVAPPAGLTRMSFRRA